MHRLLLDRDVSVRVAAIQAAASIFARLPAESRNREVETLLKHVSADKSDTVKLALAKEVGLILQTLLEEAQSSSLLDWYTTMSIQGDFAFVKACAYNFPGVLAILGFRGWDRLKSMHSALAHSNYPQIRQSIASSLAAVAEQLDWDVRQDDLLLPHLELLADSSTIVRETMLINSLAFVRLLPVSASCISLRQCYEHLMARSWSYQIKTDIMDQLAVHASDLPRQSDSPFWSILGLGLTDQISTVKYAASKAVTYLTHSL